MTSQKELIPMMPGDILRFEREQKGLSLETASEKSRIRLSVLEAIESGETHKIPSVYLKGYIRSYAHFLGIDAMDLEDHMCHVQGSEPEVRTVFTANSNRNSAEKWIKASSYAAASLLIAALAWQFTHEAVRLSQGESRLNAAGQPEQDSARTTRTAAATERKAANTHLSASIAPVEVLKQGEERSAGVAAEQAWAAIGDPDSATAGGHELELTTSADTWIEIHDAQGQQLEMDLVRAGSSRSYSATGPIRVMIGRASAVELVLNGEPVDLGPHTRGNVARMTLGSSLAAESGQATQNENR
jgi:cytoskeleton protein RodZ